MKKLFLIIGMLGTLAVSAQQKVQSTGADARQLKKAERREKINQLIKQEEEGALIYQKQGAFGFKFNTDAWSMFYEHGRYKTINKTNLWWLEFGERKDKKEEKVPTLSASQGFLVISSYIYGKRNNFYYLKGGLGQQLLIGGKGNKNGVAVSAIYGGGLSAGLLKPYYIEIQNPATNTREQIKYSPDNENLFLDPSIIIGKGNFGKGFNEITFVPGAHARAALRFDYGRYNEVLSAMEVGVNAEYYSKAMPIMLLNKEHKFFFNAYISLVFGKRK
ncbi:MAG: hypothetical protein IM584_11515 [Chitinophagaceae bacterium]|nr:hypothetical protein [Chitinophagaceae bacterium]MEA3427053.1 hypothetical protein [Bacteroidota bacterium]MCA6453398.1 hypothetical protein [Chitinophagaceae bacterium]MCA6456750.1 hypothetical protein [Chitinophagaceae bacterium]MCA6457958.1 hypothetical protein [Chitinophagaceae bacterium]